MERSGMNKLQYTIQLKNLFRNEKGHIFFGLVNVVPESLLPQKKNVFNTNFGECLQGPANYRTFKKYFRTNW